MSNDFRLIERYLIIDRVSLEKWYAVRWKINRTVVEEKPVVGLGNSWPLSLAAPGENEILEENFPFGVTVVVFVASAEATEPLKGFPVLSPLPETHPRIRIHVARILFASGLVQIDPSLLPRVGRVSEKGVLLSNHRKIPSFSLLQQSFHPRIFPFY